MSFQLPSGVTVLEDETGYCFEPYEGYRLEMVTNQPYDFIYLIAVSSERLYSLFRSLTECCLPDSVFFILEHHALEPKSYLSPYWEKKLIIDFLTPYHNFLANDGGIGFGLAHSTSDHHSEIFVDDHKIVTLFTSRRKDVEKVIKSFAIPHHEKMEFLSQYPHLHTHHPESEELIETILTRLNMRSS
ncbi:hypothetical protein DRP53_00570 [candidate division WOR-3 bacterium]|uniref:Uncharacterized protein n=1 Tax=candidate division WOR-3 bacterium TaxID=2052148 RepID=A0A660SMJ9_UNCW3|nr:MAG: hypothetical protein DRP53_00570 [candidate division WOR-3 bacterium]